MPRITLENTGTTLEGGEYPVLAPDTIIGVEVMEINEKTARNGSTGETWQKLEFTFQITSVPSVLDAGSLEGSRIWGSTTMRFTMHPDNKLRQWTEALLGGLALDEGFELDTDNLVGRRARAVVSNYTRKDGRPAHQVSGLLPAVDDSPRSPALANIDSIFADTVQNDDPPF